MKRGWFPPSLDPTKVAALILFGPSVVAAVIFAWQAKTEAAFTAAATSLLSLLTMLGLVRPNVTPLSDPRDAKGRELKPVPRLPENDGA